MPMAAPCLKSSFFWQCVNSVIGCQSILNIAPRDRPGSENSVTFLGKAIELINASGIKKVVKMGVTL